jgi:cytochrome P450
MLPTLNLLPEWWVRATNPLFAQFRAQQLENVSQVQSILSHTEETRSGSHPTVFHSLRDDTDHPLSEKSLPRLVMEAQSLIGAETLTTTHMLSMTTYHVLANPPVLSKLMAELEEAISDIATPCALQSLEQLPYLSAVIDEGLRVSYGSIHRLQRVHPDNALTFRDWTIPPGTPIGMSSLYMHDYPTIFPEPRRFDPQRWIGPETEFRQKFLFNFGRGARQGVRINLAQEEFHMALATDFRKLGTFPFVGFPYFTVSGSIPNGAGTLVLRFRWFSLFPVPAIS